MDTVWLAVAVLPAKVEFPLYVAVIVFPPEVLKITGQLPVPPVRVIVQLVSAPVRVTVPVGVEPDPVTVAVTATSAPGVDGSGVSEVMFVVEAETLDTVWLVLAELAP